MNIGNTPSRISAKASLSPLRSRRTDSSLMVGRAESSLMGRSNFARKREFMSALDRAQAEAAQANAPMAALKAAESRPQPAGALD